MYAHVVKKKNSKENTIQEIIPTTESESKDFQKYTRGPRNYETIEITSFKDAPNTTLAPTSDENTCSNDDTYSEITVDYNQNETKDVANNPSPSPPPLDISDNIYEDVDDMKYTPAVQSSHKKSLSNASSEISSQDGAYDHINLSGTSAKPATVEDVSYDSLNFNFTSPIKKSSSSPITDDLYDCADNFISAIKLTSEHDGYAFASHIEPAVESAYDFGGEITPPKMPEPKVIAQTQKTKQNKNKMKFLPFNITLGSKQLKDIKNEKQKNHHKRVEETVSDPETQPVTPPSYHTGRRFSLEPTLDFPPKSIDLKSKSPKLKKHQICLTSELAQNVLFMKQKATTKD